MRKNYIIIALSALFMLSSCSGEVSVTSVDHAEETRIVLTEKVTEVETVPSVRESAEVSTGEETLQETDMVNTEELTLEIDGVMIPVTWEENDSAEALKEFCKTGPLAIDMSMYGGFEQVGSIGQELPRNDEQTTTQSGDIVLYSGDQIVLFYGSNSWSYTKLGKMGLSEEELTELLGNGDVSIVISVT